MNMLSPSPLTDEEIKELDEFLLEAEGIEESMDISTLDGFFTAIVCGPKTIMPSEWMRWVWDMQSGKERPGIQGSSPSAACSRSLDAPYELHCSDATASTRRVSTAAHGKSEQRGSYPDNR